MAAKVRHVAINATDVQRVKAFYETVFGWRLEPWGPPDYYQDQKSGENVIIAGSVKNDQAKELFGEWEEPKPYIRIVPQPS